MIKKLLLSRKAYTILEVLLAITIVAAIALPLLSVFLQSVKTNQAAKGVLNANYISQDYIEKLDTVTYEAALGNQPTRELVDGYYISAKIKPYGAAASIFTESCDYAQLVFYADGGLLVVLPDGKWHKYSAVPSSMSLTTGGGVYTFSAGSLVLTGSTSSSYCALMINAVEKPTDTTCSITLGSSCKALRYCNKGDEEDITVNGIEEVYSGIIKGDSSLISVKVSVYETSSDTDPVAISEGCVEIKNWLL